MAESKFVGMSVRYRKSRRAFTFRMLAYVQALLSRQAQCNIFVDIM